MLFFCVDFSVSVYRNNSCVDAFIVEDFRTLCINDKSIEKSQDGEFVDFIFSKSATEKDYQTLCYAEPTAVLPDHVRQLLAPPVAAQIKSDAKDLQPV